MYGAYNWKTWVLVFYGTPGHLIVRVCGPQADWTVAILDSGIGVRQSYGLPLISWNGIVF